jgi:hypothetical protein
MLRLLALFILRLRAVLFDNIVFISLTFPARHCSGEKNNVRSESGRVRTALDRSNPMGAEHLRYPSLIPRR